MRKSEFNAARRLFCVLRAILFVHSVLFSLVQRFPSLRLPRMADGGCQMPTMVEGPFFVLRLPKIYLQKCISFSRSFLVARLTLRTRQSHQLNALHVRPTHTFSHLCNFSRLSPPAPRYFQLTLPTVINNPISFLFIIFLVFFLFASIFPCVAPFVRALVCQTKRWSRDGGSILHT